MRILLILAAAVFFSTSLRAQDAPEDKLEMKKPGIGFDVPIEIKIQSY